MPLPRLKRILKASIWIYFGLFCLVIFTVMKLPEDRIRNFVQGTISAQLANQGITLTADQSSMSIGFGISYTMKGVTLSFPPPQDPVHIEQISVAPSLLSLLSGKVGATLQLENKGGALKATYSQGMKASNLVSFSFDAANLDLGSLGILPLLANAKGSAIVTGNGSVSGDTATPSTLEGKIRLDLNKVVVDQQLIMGFSIPRLTISEGRADMTIDKGKAQINTLRLGKSSSTTDDIRATVTGDTTLGRNWQYSTLNLKANFSLSQTVLKSFMLIDALLGPAKQPDGSYSYSITGPISSPNPVPLSVGAKK